MISFTMITSISNRCLRIFFFVDFHHPTKLKMDDDYDRDGGGGDGLENL